MIRERFWLGCSRGGRRVCLDDETRSTSLHIIGAPDTGKTKLIEHLVRQDILNGEGVCLIDPHGHLYDSIVEWCETSGVGRWRNILVLDPSLRGVAFGFNPLNFSRYAQTLTQEFCIDALIRAVGQAWRENDPSRTPQLIRCLYSLFYPIADKGLTLLEYKDVLSATKEGKQIRTYLAETIDDEFIGAEWDSFNVLRTGDFEDVWRTTRNRLFNFIKAPVIRNIVGQQETTLDFLRFMNEQWVVLINLSTGNGQLSEANARLLGALMVNDMFLAAHCRSEREGREKPFHCYIDECPQFLNEDVGRVLTEGRKFGLHLCLAHQDLGQLQQEGELVYKAVMGSARTKVVFGGLIPEDAEAISALIHAGEYDLEEPKRLYDKPTVTHYVRTYFKSHGGGESRTHTVGYGRSKHEGASEGTSVSDTTNSDESSVVSTSSSTSSSQTSGTTESFSESYATTESSTWGVQEGLEPMLEWLHTQGYSLQEQIYKAVSYIINQPQRCAIVKIPARKSVRISVPSVAPGIASAERMERFKSCKARTGGFATPIAEVEQQRKQRRLQLREDLDRYVNAEVIEEESRLTSWG